MLTGIRRFPIAISPATEAYPDCDGSRVVYMSTSATTGVDISMFDRTNGATTTVSAQPWNEWMPAISGNRLVWQGWPGSGSARRHHPNLRHRPRHRRSDHRG